MAQTFTSMVRDGQSYMNEWPQRKELYALFPEARVISATRFSMKWMPPISVLCAATMLNTHGANYLPQALAIGAFFLSLPLQGLLWLGHRSNQPLPPSTKAWYQDIHAKMRAHGCEIAAAKARPKYRELAKLLKKAFTEVDRVFTQTWF